MWKHKYYYKSENFPNSGIINKYINYPGYIYKTCNLSGITNVVKPLYFNSTWSYNNNYFIKYWSNNTFTIELNKISSKNNNFLIFKIINKNKIKNRNTISLLYKITGKIYSRMWGIKPWTPGTNAADFIFKGIKWKI